MCAAFGSFHCLFYRFFQFFFQFAGFEFIFRHIRVSHHELYLECNDGGNAEGKDSPSPPGSPWEGARSASPIGRSLNQKVRVSRFDQTCNPHPALSRALSQRERGRTSIHTFLGGRATCSGNLWW